MKRKIVWLVVSCLATLSLVIVSCGPEEEEEAKITEEGGQVVITKEKEEAEEEVKVEKGEEMVRDSLGRLVEKPEYGGTLTRYSPGSPTHWDEYYSSRYMDWGTQQTTEALLQGNWAIGPTGSGEVGWMSGVTPAPSIMTGAIAESWEIVDDVTMKFNIRKGIHFQNKPPTNGRELTADDVAYSLNRIAKSPQSFAGKTCRVGVQLDSITAPDKWTVVIKSLPGWQFQVYYAYVCSLGSIIPHEVVETYSNMEDWKNVCGTGPFILKDFVVDSVVRFEKNPNYWMKDPFHPENTLPYVDNLKVMIIADKSTRLAAFRTGKIDIMDLLMEDKEAFEKTNSELLYAKALGGPPQVCWRVDTPPFTDLRVRRALWMAVDLNEIANSYYKGDAEIQIVGCYPIPELMDYYTPLDQLPESAQELFKYDPEKAMTLLREAGYPNGFKTNIYCTSSDVDILSILKGYWAAVKVDLTLNVLEATALTGVFTSRSYDQMVFRARSPWRPESLTAYAAGQDVNSSMVNDPIINEARLKSSETFLLDHAANAKLIKETLVYIIDQAFQFEFPVAYSYSSWWPWVKSYSGETFAGGRGYSTLYVKYPWIDQALKKSMGY